MLVNVRYLENLRLEANFDDFNVIADQPIRYKGDGTAPGPYDYFLASSALCAAYFVKLYCNTRDIPTDDIKVYQQNIVDPENRYHQDFHIQIELPASISEKDKKGILASMERCTVKRVIQNQPKFIIEAIDVLGGDKKDLYEYDKDKRTHIKGKDKSLEETITEMTRLLSDLGINIEIASWRNPVPHVWSVHIRDADSPMCFTNGKGATKDAALCSALGEYIERIGNNYFYNDFYLGTEIANSSFVHYPDEKWFKLQEDDSLPVGLMDSYLKDIYSLNSELKGSHLVDTNSGNIERGICAIPFTRISDKSTAFIPVNLIGNLFVSNGMSAGNSIFEARVQALSEIFERAVKNQIITEELTLPEVPKEVIKQFPKIEEGIKTLEDKGFPVFVKDASLGGRYPVMCVTIMNPKTGGVFASFGSHPCFEVALERSLTELLQGRSFEGLNDIPKPTFSKNAVIEQNNIIDHFIDSTGVISWKFFSNTSPYEFVHWDFTGSTEEEFNFLMEILTQEDKEVYIADYTDLGSHACRILVPNYSEIYPKEDLIWDNNNQSLKYRDRILSIHSLADDELEILLQDLEESELDNYMPVSELIGIAFDENSTWGQLDIGELKCLINLALGNLWEAKDFIEMFYQFNDNLPERRMFYQCLGTVLDIILDDELDIDHYQSSLIRMYGITLFNEVIDIINGELKFYGLTKTDLNFNGLDKHQRLLDSYKKLMKKRS
jgi:ribosomal protein S12 methylthiotransferase accessory factor